MGIRGELFSTRVLLANRTYFFNIKENRNGDLYLNVVESKNKDEGGFERQSVIVFAEDLQEFLSGFDDALRVLEKEVREKRRFSPRPYEQRPYSPRSSGGEEGGRGRRGEPWRGEAREGRYRGRESSDGGERAPWRQDRREGPDREGSRPRRKERPRDD